MRPDPLVITLDDAEVARIEAEAGAVQFRLAVAALATAAAGPRDPDAPALVTGVLLRCEAVRGLRLAPGAVGRVRTGELMVDGARRPTLEVPGRLQGALRLELQFANGSLCILHAGVLELRLQEGAQLRPSYRC